MTNEDRKKIENMRSDEDWYRCVDCKELAFANREHFKGTITRRRGKCLDCLAIDRKTKENEKRKLRAQDSDTHTIYCAVCKKPFEGKSAETCSPKCRKKHTEHKKFYRGLAKANIEVRSAKIHVYGTKDYAGSTTSKKITEYVKITKEEIKHEEDGYDYDDDSTK